MPPNMGVGDSFPDVDTPTVEGVPGEYGPHIRVQDDSHTTPQKPQPHHLQDDESFMPRRLTPRPSFLENLVDSRDRQFMLHRRQSTDVDRYFVCFFLLLLSVAYRGRLMLTDCD